MASKEVLLMLSLLMLPLLFVLIQWTRPLRTRILMWYDTIKRPIIRYNNTTQPQLKRETQIIKLKEEELKNNQDEYSS